MAVQKKAQKNANTTRQKPLDFILCIIIFLLLALGIVMVLSASAPSSLSTYGNSYHYVIRQGIFAIVGIAVMFFVSKLDFRIYKHFYKIAYWVGIAALLLVVIPKIGVEINGAKRWADLGFGTFQPSEITKICLIIFYAGYLTEHRNELGYFWKGFVKAYVPLILPIAKSLERINSYYFNYIYYDDNGRGKIKILCRKWNNWRSSRSIRSYYVNCQRWKR